MYGAGREVNEEWVAWWEESSEGSGLGGVADGDMMWVK